MNKIQKKFQLLWLLVIFFGYKAISGYLSGNSGEFIAWTIFLFIYVISLIISYLVLNKQDDF
ncbi:MAG: hypothetical protein ACTSQP_11630 [Promethearchaeota archaeon]